MARIKVMKRIALVLFAALLLILPNILRGGCVTPNITVTPNTLTPTVGELVTFTYDHVGGCQCYRLLAADDLSELYLKANWLELQRHCKPR